MLVCDGQGPVGDVQADPEDQVGLQVPDWFPV